MNKDVLITNIQRFSLHDGPGIRTTIFLKGCSLRCPWCSNPENLSTKIQNYKRNNDKGVYGKWYDVETLYSIILKDKKFYKGKISNYLINSAKMLNKLPGGVTLSGGEALIQTEKILPLMEMLNKDRIHVAVETCLFISEKLLKAAINYIDLFYVDIKILDLKKCEEILNGDLLTYMSNLDLLFDSGKPIVFRVPVINGYTDSSSNRKKVAKLIAGSLRKGNILKVELIKEHNLGLSKYEALASCNEISYIPEYKEISACLMEDYKNYILHEINYAIPVEICKVY